MGNLRLTEVVFAGDSGTNTIRVCRSDGRAVLFACERERARPVADCQWLAMKNGTMFDYADFCMLLALALGHHRGHPWLSLEQLLRLPAFLRRRRAIRTKKTLAKHISTILFDEENLKKLVATRSEVALIGWDGLPNSGPYGLVPFVSEHQITVSVSGVDLGLRSAVATAVGLMHGEDEKASIPGHGKGEPRVFDLLMSHLRGWDGDPVTPEVVVRLAGHADRPSDWVTLHILASGLPPMEISNFILVRAMQEATTVSSLASIYQTCKGDDAIANNLEVIIAERVRSTADTETALRACGGDEAAAVRMTAALLAGPRSVGDLLAMATILTSFPGIQNEVFQHLEKLLSSDVVEWYRAALTLPNGHPLMASAQQRLQLATCQSLVSLAAAYGTGGRGGGLSAVERQILERVDSVSDWVAIAKLQNGSDSLKVRALEQLLSLPSDAVAQRTACLLAGSLGREGEKKRAQRQYFGLLNNELIGNFYAWEWWYTGGGLDARDRTPDMVIHLAKLACTPCEWASVLWMGRGDRVPNLMDLATTALREVKAPFADWEETWTARDPPAQPHLWKPLGADEHPLWRLVFAKLISAAQMFDEWRRVHDRAPLGGRERHVALHNAAARAATVQDWRWVLIRAPEGQGLRRLALEKLHGKTEWRMSEPSSSSGDAR